METFTIKQHDTAPPIRASLTDQLGAADLSDADSIRLLGRHTKTNATIEGTGEIVSGPAGTVVYEWSPGDTDEPGIYNGEFEVTYIDGTVSTFPNEGYFRIKIIADLG